MTLLLLIGLLVGVIWGALWAAVLEWSAIGRFLVRHRTWITVVVGVIGNLAILFIVLPPGAVLTVFAVFAASGVPMVIRSLVHEYRKLEDAISVLGDAHGD